MKLKLLNDGEFVGMNAVNFPVVVDACRLDDGFLVNGAELIRVGADPDNFDAWTPYYFSLLSKECEVVE